MPIEIFDKFTVPTFRIDTINNAIKSVLGFVNVGRFSNNSQAIFVYLPVAIVNYVLMFYKSNIYAWLFVFLSCAKSNNQIVSRNKKRKDLLSEFKKSPFYIEGRYKTLFNIQNPSLKHPSKKPKKVKAITQINPELQTVTDDLKESKISDIQKLSDTNQNPVKTRNENTSESKINENTILTNKRPKRPRIFVQKDKLF